MKHNEEEKIEIVETICSLYETENCTIESACQKSGITVRCFNKWVVENSGFSERYEKAKKIARETHWNTRLVPKAETALERLLTGDEYEEVTEEYEMKEDEYGELVEQMTKRKVVKKRVLPNPTAVIFVSKAADPQKFVEYTHTKVEGQINTDSAFLSLPLESQVQIIEILNKTKESNDGTPQ